MRAHLAFAIAVVLFGRTSSFGATELEVFEKKVKKYAADVFDIFDKPKGLCVCINDPGNADNNGMAGVLDSMIVGTADVPPRRVRVRCMVIKASDDGNVTQAESCENFVPLAK